ncbi:MAG: ABC transporter permease [Pygmaiobacter sp.]|nr:ABC transporter permease [Pygmaiobacter sp.]
MIHKKATGASKTILLFIAFLSVLLWQVWLLQLVKEATPSAFECEDTRIAPTGWQEATAALANTGVGLCTAPVPKDIAVGDGGGTASAGVCLATADFAQTNQLHLLAGAFCAAQGGQREAVLPRGIAQSLGKNVGDTIQIGNENYRISGIYAPAALLEQGGDAPVLYVNWLPTRDELAVTSYRVQIPLGGNDLEQKVLYDLYSKTHYAPFGKAVNFASWQQLLGQVLWLELLEVFLYAAIGVTASGFRYLMALLCRKQKITSKAVLANLTKLFLPFFLFGSLLGRLNIPSAFMPTENIFDFAVYAHIAASVRGLVQAGYGFSAALGRCSWAFGALLLSGAGVVALAALLLFRLHKNVVLHGGIGNAE